MAKEIKPLSLPAVQQMPAPPDARIIPLERQTPLTHAQVEQVRFGLGDTGPLAQAMLNANVPAVMKQLTIGAVSCLSTRKPADPVVGQMIFETDTQQVKFWNGTLWVTPANGAPSGSLNPFAGSTAPTGWLLCDGASLLRADYPALFAVIKTAYGSVDATHFNIPDMRGRAAFGKDDMGGTAQNRITNTASGITATTLGATGGDQLLPDHTHSIAHDHASFNTASAGTHTHTDVGLPDGTGFKKTVTGVGATGTSDMLTSSTSTFVSRDTGYQANSAGSAHAHAIDVPAFSGNSPSPNTPVAQIGGASANMPPTMILNYIIKT